MNQINYTKDRFLWQKAWRQMRFESDCNCYQLLFVVIQYSLFCLHNQECVVEFGLIGPSPNTQRPYVSVISSDTTNAQMFSITPPQIWEWNLHEFWAAGKRRELQNSEVRSKAKSFSWDSFFSKNYPKTKWLKFESLQRVHIWRLYFLDRRIFLQQIWTGHNPRKWFFTNGLVDLINQGYKSVNL